MVITITQLARQITNQDKYNHKRLWRGYNDWSLLASEEAVSFSEPDKKWIAYSSSC